MATDDHEALLARASESEVGLLWDEPGDLAHLSVAAFVAHDRGDARALRSSGSVRLHGGGVRGHSVDLDEVGRIARQWQRATTAIGAALSGVKSARGRVPDDIAARTRLALTGAPQPGSLVLHLEPAADPLAEVEPHGQRPMFDVSRPLADMASEMLLNVLAEVPRAGISDLDPLSESLRELGPRAAASLHDLATTLHAADVDLDASWTEPSAGTRRANLSVSGARWLAKFIEGRDLASEEEPLTGIAETVSNRERWLIATADGGIERIVASSLDLTDVRRVRPGDFVTLLVRSSRKAQPDGTIVTRREALQLLSVEAPD
ncbi:hypothetical protein [Cellulomonas sp. GbtcB1]|uniref:hypothetical protein n=1 Tax=Cellulomonas sp. GbtcB1 TaxID=2824746 RepID=UPI001C2F2A27|nr:hypothetical protein [Cellulomonas sp. GbtcB1]